MPTGVSVGRGQSVLGGILARAMLPKTAKADVRRVCNASSHRPSVSVVIPCYNYGRYLSECVRSVLGQQGVHVDVLIIDDASPDGSAEVARRLAGQDARVRIICHQKNQGHIATYNEGLARASGDYSLLLSADDRLTPGCLARATSLMEEYPSVGLTYGFPVDFTDTNLPPARTVATNWIIWRGHDWIAHRCKTGQNVLRSPEAVIRTSVMREIGDYRADLPHTGDLEMWMRAATVSDIGYVCGADQAYYRIHQNNMHHTTFNMRSDMFERMRSFDIFFAEQSAELKNPDAMRDQAHRTLAREALGNAISAYARGAAEQETVDNYVKFALEAWPEAERLPEWRTLCRLRIMGDGRLKRDPSVITRERVRTLRYAFRWWRWRWAGVY